MRIEAKLGLASVSVILIAAACGGRSGTEIFGYDHLFEEAGVGAGGTGYGGGIVEGGTLGGSGGTAGTSGTAGIGGTGASSGSGGVLVDGDVPDVVADTGPADAKPDGKDFFDALPPLPEGGPIGECVGCLQQQCGEEINACYNDPTCVEGIQCTITDCLVGGGGGGAGGSGGGGGGIDFMCVLGCFDNDIGSAMTAISMFTCITESCGDECGLSGAGGAGGSSGQSLNGLNLPSGLFGFREERRVQRSAYYIGSTRVPRPEEVASAYPWLAELLAGRMPNPPPPCILERRARQ